MSKASKKSASVRLDLQWRDTLGDYVTAIAWSPDGLTLATGSAAGEVVLWSFKSSTTPTRLDLAPGTDQSIDGLTWSADGTLLAAGSQDGTVRIWQPHHHPEPIQQLPHAPAWIDQLAWHPQHPWLAFGCNRTVYVWDQDHQATVAILEFAASSVLNLAWHPTGTHLAVSGHGHVKVWSSQNWQAEPEAIAVPGASLVTAWSSQGHYLASGNLDRTLTVMEWDVPPPWFMQGFPGKVRQLAWSDPNTATGAPLLAAACMEGITVWERESPSGGVWRCQVLDQHQNTVNAIAFRPQSLLLASAGEDGRVCLWQGKQLLQILKGAPSGFSSLAWAPQGDRLAVGGRDGEILVWHSSSRATGFG